LAAIVLVLGIAQLPALLVTLPVIAYIWWSPSYGTGAAVMHTVLLALAWNARQHPQAAAARPRGRSAHAP
jgi:hypothetical protein